MNGNKKGLAMPMNVLIIIAIGILALVSLAAVFFSGSFGQISEAEAQRIFSTGCARYCQPDQYQTLKNAYLASKNDPSFVSSCERLGYGDKDHIDRCFQRCSNCNVNIDQSDVNSGHDNLLLLSQRP